MEKYEKILEILGFPKDFEASLPNCDEEGIFYFYDLFKKDKEGKISFIEALDVYTQSRYGKGFVVLFTKEGEPERIEPVLKKEMIERPYLGHFMHLPNKFKKILENKIHAHYQENKEDKDVKIIIGKSRKEFYFRFVYTKTLKKREIWSGQIAEAGYSFFGKHFTEFAQDIEKVTANLLYLMFDNKTYFYDDPELKEKGRLKILKKLDDLGYLNKKESEMIKKDQ